MEFLLKLQHADAVSIYDGIYANILINIIYIVFI